MVQAVVFPLSKVKVSPLSRSPPVRGPRALARLLSKGYDAERTVRHALTVDMSRICRHLTLLGLAFWGAAVTADVQHNRWCQVTTPDFKLVTDLRPRDRVALARGMTGFKRVLQVLTKERLEGPPLTMVAFRRVRDARRVFTTPDIDGTEILLRERSTVAFNFDRTYPRRGRPLDAYREYAHYLLRCRQDLDYPAWYDEGYAFLVSTMYSSKERVIVGHVPPIVRPSMNRADPTLRELLRAPRPFRSGGLQQQGLFAKAWLLVHMLELGHFAGLTPHHSRVPELLAMIDGGEPAEVAVERGLGVDMATLQRQLDEYGQRKSLPKVAVHVDFEDKTTMDSRCLDDNEIRHMLADLAAVTRNHEYAAELYEEVIAEDPEDVDALVGLSYSLDDTMRSRALARRALAVDPDHPRAVDRMAELKAEAR